MKGQRAAVASASSVAFSLLFTSVVLLHVTHLAHAAPLAQSDAASSGHSAVKHDVRAQEGNEEEQLEKLKTLPANVAVSKTQTKTLTKINGKTEMHRTKEETVEDTASGQTLSKISQHLIQTSSAGETNPKTVLKTEIDIPSKGIHEVTVSKKPKKQQQQQQQRRRRQGQRVSSDAATLDAALGADPMAEDYYSPYEGVQYSPGDMAEYIRRTGDDEGVALAVEELMREGLMSRNEAASYLEEVKNELEFIQQDRLMMKHNEQRNVRVGQQQQQPIRHQSLYLEQQHPRGSVGDHDDHRPSNSPQQQHLAPSVADARHEAAPPSGNGGRTNSYPSSSSLLVNAKRTLGQSSEDEESLSPRVSAIRGRPSELAELEDEDDDGGDLLERLRIADFLYKEYSLEEVIYQLAKEMFTQSIVKGNRDAEESLQRFSNFLQEETNEGRISKELETKILDVVMAALMDAVGGGGGGGGGGHPSAPEQQQQQQLRGRAAGSAASGGAAAAAAATPSERLRNAVGSGGGGGGSSSPERVRNEDVKSPNNRIGKAEKSAQNKEQITYDKNNERRDAKV